MNDSTINQFETLTDNQLHEILRDNTPFTEALILRVPELASDATFDLYGSEWLKRHWKTVIFQIQSGLTSKGALEWALDATAAGLAAALAKRFDLPEAAIPGGIALAILIIRAAKGEHEKTSREKKRGNADAE